MPEPLLTHLGFCIHRARADLGLTQETLSEQTGISVRHIANIEKGRMNPSYEILKLLIGRLGISADLLFHIHNIEQDTEFLEFVGKYNACTEGNRRILFRTLNCLADELLQHQVLPKRKPEEMK